MRIWKNDHLHPPPTPQVKEEKNGDPACRQKKKKKPQKVQSRGEVRSWNLTTRNNYKTKSERK